jgi:hypothetical protein
LKLLVEPYIFQLFGVPSGFVVRDIRTEGGATTYSGVLSTPRRLITRRILASEPEFSITLDEENLPVLTEFKNERVSSIGPIVSIDRIHFVDYGATVRVKRPPKERVITIRLPKGRPGTRSN